MGRSTKQRRAAQWDATATSRGILSNGTLVANYYTAEPSPDQWVAVGTVMFWPTSQDGGFPRWLLVGVGRSEQLAVADLRARMKDASPRRWRIKCASNDSDADSGRAMPDSDTLREYVVPWEIGNEELSVPPARVAERESVSG